MGFLGKVSNKFLKNTSEYIRVGLIFIISNFNGGQKIKICAIYGRKKNKIIEIIVYLLVCLKLDYFITLQVYIFQ